MLTTLTMLLSGGMLFVMGLCPLRLVAWQLVRLIGILSLVMTGFVVIWDIRQDGLGELGSWPVFSAIGLAIGSIGLTLVTPETARNPDFRVHVTRVLSLVAGGLGIWSGLLWAGRIEGMAEAISGTPILAFGSLVLSAYLLGSVTFGWLLGHRYLTATEMTIDPLLRVSRLLIGATCLRGLLLAATAGYLIMFSDRQSPDSLLVRAGADWLMVSIRVGIGLVLPAVFVYMAHQCAKLRSTQSATGILFFTFVFIIVGELTSLYLGSRAGLWV